MSTDAQAGAGAFAVAISCTGASAGASAWVVADGSGYMSRRFNGDGRRSISESGSVIGSSSRIGSGSGIRSLARQCVRKSSI